MRTRNEVLETAAKLINGKRDTEYGGPEDSFTVIAEFWTTYLIRTKGTAFRLRPHDVAIMMGLLKIARLTSSDGQHQDSWVDLAGYAACGSECLALDESKPDIKTAPENKYCSSCGKPTTATYKDECPECAIEGHC